jgi:hypothetical protein
MTKQLIIERTIKIINQLPDSKAEEISDFVDFVIKRYEEQILNDDISQALSESKAFDFLRYENDLYSVEDLKTTFNEKR